MGLQIVTPASVLPVSLDEARTWCGVEDTSFDSLLTVLLASACARVAAMIEQPLGATVFRLALDDFSDAIELPRWPVTAVASVQYVDLDGNTQTADPALYTLDMISRPAWVVLNEAEAWPDAMDRVNAVTVNFTAGWTAGTLPADIQGAVLLLVAHWFTHRAAAVSGTIINDIPFGVTDLLSPYRMIRI